MMARKAAWWLLALAATLLAVWALAAAWLTPVPVGWRVVLLLAGVGAVVAGRRFAPGVPAALAVAVAALVVGVVLRLWPEARSERTWIEEQGRQATVAFGVDTVTIRDVRNFRYAGRGKVARARWDTRRYQLSQVASAWFGVSHFGGVPGVGHVFVSFGFDDGRYLAISVEARKEQAEVYSPWRGIFRSYEAIYVVADERDAIALRTNVWGDDVWLYPVRGTREAMRAVLVDMLERANTLAAEPEFYDTITNSCSVNLARHVNRVVPGLIPPSIKILLAGFADELAYGVGVVDFDGTMEEARARFHINARAAGDIDAGDFSARIRAVSPPPAPAQ